jgi:hypothetical protein
VADADGPGSVLSLEEVQAPGSVEEAPTVVISDSRISQTSLDELIRDFAKHTDRVGYYGRLRTGQSIGSGGVESLAKRMGRRLKVPGRGWCVDHLEGMSALIATADTPEWESLWPNPPPDLQNREVHPSPLTVGNASDRRRRPCP